MSVMPRCAGCGMWYSGLHPDPVACALERCREAAHELTGWPGRLHTAGVQPQDLLGAPRLHPAFWRWLTSSLHDTRTVRYVERCPMDHPIGEVCPRCGNLFTYPVDRFEYARPFARALWVSARRGSRLRPHPVRVVLDLIRAGFVPAAASALWGEPVVSPDHLKTVEARCVSAIRTVMGQYERTVIPATSYSPRITEAIA